MAVLNPLDEYLEKYCRQNKVTKEEAMKHALVREVTEYYRKTGGLNDSSFMRRVPGST